MDNYNYSNKGTLPEVAVLSTNICNETEMIHLNIKNFIEYFKRYFVLKLDIDLDEFGVKIYVDSTFKVSLGTDDLTLWNHIYLRDSIKHHFDYGIFAFGDTLDTRLLFNKLFYGIDSYTINNNGILELRY